MWTGLNGKWAYRAGTSGTETLPSGAVITQILALGDGATISIFGGTAIPVFGSSGFKLQMNHMLACARESNKTVVFTSTDSYYLEYVVPGFG